jgi:hypothetical protein
MHREGSCVEDCELDLSANRTSERYILFRAQEHVYTLQIVRMLGLVASSGHRCLLHSRATPILLY